MSLWTWKQAVAEQILDIVNSRRDTHFDLHDLYRRQHVLHDLFPRNQNVRPKMRQMLQRLRDAGFIEFLGSGAYQLVTTYSDLDCERAPAGESGIKLPLTRTVVRRVRLRNTFLAAEMKRRYRDTCQVCRERLELASCTYAESHHIKPLGTPHNGPDVEGNILVVCPNHHVMFDRGALIVDPSSFIVSHVSNAIPPRRLLLQSWHKLNPRYLDYQKEIAFGRA